MIRETSMEAYKNLDLIESEARIMRFLHSLPPGTALNRRQISERSGIPVNAVAGRTHSLLQKGYLQEMPAERDPETGKSAHPLRITPKQADLFDDSQRMAA